MTKISYHLTERQSKVVLPEKLLFGKIFTDHMFQMDYDQEKGGWTNARIEPFGNIALSPAAMVLHYGQTVFEGMKAYTQPDGKIALFRPEKNFERLLRSCKKLAIPLPDKDFLLEALMELVRVDKDWVPKKVGHSLYIRPLVFAMDPILGVHASKTYRLVIMLSPVGPYYPEGFSSVSILAQNDYVRAVRKGLGDAKTAANYAASIAAAEEAKAQGFTQVLWLDAIEQKYLEEVGTMNIFVRFKNEVATPALTGSILPGVTRMSVLEILRDKGYNVNERLIGISELVDEYDKGRLIEVFGTGTAAVISSLGRLHFKDKDMLFNNGNVGILGSMLYEEITGIQYGLKPDKYGWLTYLK